MGFSTWNMVPFTINAVWSIHTDISTNLTQQKSVGVITKNLFDSDKLQSLKSLAESNVINICDLRWFHSIHHNIDVLPFDVLHQLSQLCCIGLCPPGIGDSKYYVMKHGLFEVLIILLPHLSNKAIGNLIILYQNQGYDRYALLRAVIKHVIDGVDNCCPHININ